MLPTRSKPTDELKKALLASHADTSGQKTSTEDTEKLAESYRPNSTLNRPILSGGFLIITIVDSRIY